MVVSMPKADADWLETLHPDSLGESFRVRHDIWVLTPHTADRLAHIAALRTADTKESVEHAQRILRRIERSWA